MNITPLCRFERHFIKESSGCWLWRGYLTFGYGDFRFKGKKQKAHRVSYQLYVGEIPAGKLVLHTCDKPACVNPSHLFIGTQQDNMDDKMEKGRFRNGHSEKTHCKQGHIFNDSNTMARKRGGRICRTCHNRRNAEYRNKNVSAWMRNQIEAAYKRLPEAAK